MCNCLSLGGDILRLMCHSLSNFMVFLGFPQVPSNQVSDGELVVTSCSNNNNYSNNGGSNDVDRYKNCEGLVYTTLEFDSVRGGGAGKAGSQHTSLGTVRITQESIVYASIQV